MMGPLLARALARASARLARSIALDLCRKMATQHPCNGIVNVVLLGHDVGTTQNLLKPYRL